MIAKPLVYCHRGGAAYFPENSIPAVKYSLTLDVDYIDMDVVLTQDKTLIVYHDLTLCSQTTRDENLNYVFDKTPIKHISTNFLKRYNIGKIRPGCARDLEFPFQAPLDNVSISTLDEMISFILSSKKPIKFQVEVKINPRHPILIFQ